MLRHRGAVLVEGSALSRTAKLLAKVLSGNSDANIGFNELCSLLQRLGFAMRVRGSHHVFNRRGLTSPINLQDIAGNAKEYQVRQVRRILLEQGLTSIRGDRDGD
jgi:uncharacterized membrane protein (DUF2068 family)